MQRQWQYWTLAVLGLMLGAALLGAMLRGGTPMWGRVQAGGGADAGVIAFTSDSGTATQRLYIVDTQQKVFTVYESPRGSRDVRLVYGRPFGLDLKLAGKGEVAAPRTGDLTVKDVERELKRIGDK